VEEKWRERGGGGSWFDDGEVKREKKRGGGPVRAPPRSGRGRTGPDSVCGQQGRAAGGDGRGSSSAREAGDEGGGSGRGGP
jgi:hypothetical protein